MGLPGEVGVAIVVGPLECIVTDEVEVDWTIFKVELECATLEVEVDLIMSRVELECGTLEVKVEDRDTCSEGLA